MIFPRRTRHVASIVSLFWVLSACALAQSQPPTPSGGNEERQPQPQETRPYQDQRGTEANPLVIRELRSQEQADADQQDRRDEQANRRYALWLSLVTLVVIAFQVWLLLRQNTIISGQSDILERQAKHMEDGLIETRRSADAAASAVQISEQSLITNARAYVLHSAWEVDAFWDKPRIGGGPPILKGVRITPVFRNFGNTPALDVRASTLKVRAESVANVDPRFAHENASAPLPPADTTLAPRDPFGGAQIMLPVEEIEVLRKNAVSFFVHTLCEYREMSPNRPVHHTSVCARIKFNPLATPDNRVPILVFEFGAPEHNDAD